MPRDDSVIVAPELKTESQERGEPIQLLRRIRQLLSQVPDQGIGNSARQQQGGSRAPLHVPGGCHRGWWCWWDGAGDLCPGPSLQLNAEFGMDPGPQDDASTMDTLTFCWRKAEGKQRKQRTKS